MCQYLFKTKKKFFIFLPFLWIFSTLPSTQTIKLFRSNFFFFELPMKNWAMNMHLNPIPILQGLFLGLGAFFKCYIYIGTPCLFCRSAWLHNIYIYLYLYIEREENLISCITSLFRVISFSFCGKMSRKS